jgi:hypothetical protein
MFVEIQRHRIESAVETLTAEQQARWKELTGKPIEGDGLFYLIGRTVSVR